MNDIDNDWYYEEPEPRDYDLDWDDADQWYAGRCDREAGE